MCVTVRFLQNFAKSYTRIVYRLARRFAVYYFCLQRYKIALININVVFRDKHKRYASYADSTFDLLGQLGGRNWNYTKKIMQNSYIPAPSTVSFCTEYKC